MGAIQCLPLTKLLTRNGCADSKSNSLAHETPRTASAPGPQHLYTPKNTVLSNCFTRNQQLTKWKEISLCSFYKYLVEINEERSLVNYLFLLLAWSQSSQPPCATILSKYVYAYTILEYWPIARPTYSGPVPVTLQRTNAKPVFSYGYFLSWAAMDPNLVAIECSSQSWNQPIINCQRKSGRWN